MVRLAWVQEGTGSQAQTWYLGKALTRDNSYGALNEPWTSPTV